MNSETIYRLVEEVNANFKEENFEGIIYPCGQLLKHILEYKEIVSQKSLSVLYEKINMNEIIEALANILDRSIQFFEIPKEEYGEYYELDYYDQLSNFRVDFEVIVALPLLVLSGKLVQIENKKLLHEIDD